ncbi:MAG: hypothetical protein DRH21_00430 [Deltaproteobacteria bacterium]|nr:MAG: hypothetical protein DRH21_00430 [Deltaproteobacteria bacterium]
MGQRLQKYEDLCPECGHLLPKETWNCSFCGRSLHDLKIHDSRIGSWDDYTDLNKMSSIEEDFDRLLVNS